MRALIPLGLLAILLTAPTGCGRPATDPRSAPPPAAFDPERFPDVPIPPGYVPRAGEDHLAVSHADGALRRYHVVLEHATEDEAFEGEELRAWLDRRLHARGWELGEDRWPRRQVWRKRGPGGQMERLLLETGRVDRRTIIRLVLTPAAAAPAPESTQATDRGSDPAPAR